MPKISKRLKHYKKRIAQKQMRKAIARFFTLQRLKKIYESGYKNYAQGKQDPKTYRKAFGIKTKTNAYKELDLNPSVYLNEYLIAISKTKELLYRTAGVPIPGPGERLQENPK